MTATELATGIRRYLPPPARCASVPHRQLDQLVGMVLTPAEARVALGWLHIVENEFGTDAPPEDVALEKKLEEVAHGS